MSSTEKTPPDGKTQELLHRFWVEKILPTATALRARGVKFFDAGPRPGAASYFIDHQPAADPFYTIEPEQTASLLKQLWARDSAAELTALAEPLIGLAPQLAPRKEDEGDVSPFIYVMF